MHSYKKSEAYEFDYLKAYVLILVLSILIISYYFYTLLVLVQHKMHLRVHHVEQKR